MTMVFCGWILGFSILKIGSVLIQSLGTMFTILSDPLFSTCTDIVWGRVSYIIILKSKLVATNLVMLANFMGDSLCQFFCCFWSYKGIKLLSCYEGPILQIVFYQFERVLVLSAHAVCHCQCQNIALVYGPYSSDSYPKWNLNRIQSSTVYSSMVFSSQTWLIFQAIIDLLRSSLNLYKR